MILNMNEKMIHLRRMVIGSLILVLMVVGSVILALIVGATWSLVFHPGYVGVALVPPVIYGLGYLVEVMEKMP